MALQRINGVFKRIPLCTVNMKEFVSSEWQINRRLIILEPLETSTNGFAHIGASRSALELVQMY